MSAFWQKVRDDRGIRCIVLTGAGRAHEVLAPDALLPRAHELARTMAMQSPTALRQSLRILRRYARSLIADQLDDGWAVAFGHFSHPDGTEGPLAFLEKRAPRWA